MNNQNEIRDQKNTQTNSSETDSRRIKTETISEDKKASGTSISRGIEEGDKKSGESEAEKVNEGKVEEDKTKLEISGDSVDKVKEWHGGHNMNQNPPGFISGISANLKK
jgi:hypothetical protein